MIHSAITSRAGKFLVIHEESFSSVGISSNVYVAKLAGKHYLFDTSGHPDVVSFLKTANVAVESISAAFLTHGHYDHTMGLISLSKVGVPAYISMEDADLLESSIGKVDVKDLSDSKKILRELGLEAIATPGHSRGSVCYYAANEKLLISGDTVFSNGCFGRTDLNGGSDLEMKTSLKLLAGLNVEAILPGHGFFTMSKGRDSISAALANAAYLLR
jgi:glyoxylase-like metal-dependent hydrolase (beta-lactamase superfamily II)